MKQIDLLDSTLEDNENINPRDNGVSGERKLLAAVLERAALDLTSDDREMAYMSGEWFNEAFVDNPELYTFQYVCFMLDLDPLSMRNKAFQFRDRKKNITKS